ncbi:MAG: DUF11 domain-containing protein [bacterium]|nr:DUF11 domain-containing protein [bacterium]
MSKYLFSLFNNVSKRLFILLSFSLLVLTTLVGQQSSTTIKAQGAGQQTTHLEIFGTGAIPPQFNPFFNHSFSHGSAWDITGSVPSVPAPPSEPSYLELYWDTEDTVTINLTGRDYVGHASVWGYADPAQNGLPAGRGRVTFVGEGDSKTVYFTGGSGSWQYFEASNNDLGDQGGILGEITAVKLAKLVQQDGNSILFDDLAFVAVTPPAMADLDLTINGPASPVTVGDTIAYNFTLTNSGPDTANNVILENILPFGVSFNATQSSAGCTAVNRDVTCVLGNLGSGAQANFTIGANVSSAACATLYNQATVYSNTYDPNAANNIDSHAATTPAPACADLELTQTGLPIPIEPGDEFTYALVLTNHGSDAAAATVTTTLPTAVSFIGVYPDSGITCSQSGGAINCSAASLAAGQESRINIHVSANANAAGIIAHPAAITGAINDPDPLNNSSNFRFAIGRAYDFTIIGEVGVGDLASYTQIGGIAMNDNGTVAFHVQSDRTVMNPYAPDYYGIFYGNGGGLTRVVDETDFVPLPSDQGHFIGPYVDNNNDNTVVFVHRVLQDAAPLLGQNLLETTILTGNGGPLTTIVTDSKAASGYNFRRFGLATINNGGRVAASYYISTIGYSYRDGIVTFENGVEALIANTLSDDFSLRRVGQTNNNFVTYLQRSDISSINTLYRRVPSQIPLVVAQSPAQFDRFDVKPHISINDQGNIAYIANQLDANTGLETQTFYVQQTPIFSVAYQGFFSPIISPHVNNLGRIAFETRSSGGSSFGSPGIYVGPHPIAHKVIDDDPVAPDPLFDSTVTHLVMGDFNDAGQVAFQASLTNGRTLIVRADPVFDHDQDGVLDYLEGGAANNSDGNVDGIPDSAQLNVASLPNQVDNRYVTIAADPNATLTNVAAIPNPSPGDSPPDSEFPLGHFSFEVHDVPVGGATAVTIYLPPGMAAYNYYKYGATPANSTPHWYLFDYNGLTGAQILGNKIILHFVDGGRGDADLTANGVIVDPGGPTSFPFSIFLPLISR